MKVQINTKTTTCCPVLVVQMDAVLAIVPLEATSYVWLVQVVQLRYCDVAQNETVPMRTSSVNISQSQSQLNRS